MKTGQKKIFLSHASADGALADRLIELLTTGCDISPNDILCTSEPGMGVPIGNENFIEYLQKQMQNPALVILLISQNYFASPFCLCELGATWGLKLPTFPLVVPPVNKANLKATLLVTQAGYVNDLDCLHELRDRIEDDLGKSVPTALWDAKARSFVAAADRIIKSLPTPSQVPKAKLTALQEEYDGAVQVIASKEDEIRQLKAQVADLEKLKNKEQVREVRQKYLTTQKEFEILCHEASAALGHLKSATCRALFFEQRSEEYRPDGREEWADAEAAAAVQEIDAITEDDTCVSSNREHPRVHKASVALNALRKFLSKDRNEKFFGDLEDEHGFPMSIENREFWQEFLSNV